MADRGSAERRESEQLAALRAAVGDALAQEPDVAAAYLYGSAGRGSRSAGWTNCGAGPRVVDPHRLRALLSRLRARRRDLERYARLETDEFLAEPERVHAAKYLLVTAIEDALAAANHVIASEGYRAPADYEDAFRSLREPGVLPRPLAERLEAMARFRNLLVHVYAEVDDRRVHEFLRRDLEDLDRYVEAPVDTFPEAGSPR